MESEYSNRNPTLKERIKAAYQSIPVPMLIFRKVRIHDPNDELDYIHNFHPVPHHSVKLVKIKDFGEEHRKNKEARDYFRERYYRLIEEEYDRRVGRIYPLQSFEVRQVLEKFKKVREEGRRLMKNKAERQNSDITDKL